MSIPIRKKEVFLTIRKVGDIDPLGSIPAPRDDWQIERHVMKGANYQLLVLPETTISDLICISQKRRTNIRGYNQCKLIHAFLYENQ